MIFVSHVQNLIFRQAKNSPRSENALLQQLQEDELQLKRIRVNAQVTFMISILEMIGAVIGIMVVVIFKSTTLPVIINSMILYLILLPRAFLMNTSHNKGRVIEHGWKNILRNTLGLSPKSSNSNSNQERERVENEISSRSRKKRAKRHGMSSKIASSTTDKPSLIGSTSILKKAINEDVSECRNVNQKRAEIIMNPSTLERPDQTIISTISKEMESVKKCQGKMDFTANRSSKIGRLKNNKLVVTDLELESENVFSFK